MVPRNRCAVLRTMMVTAAADGVVDDDEVERIAKVYESVFAATLDPTWVRTSTEALRSEGLDIRRTRGALNLALVVPPPRSSTTVPDPGPRERSMFTAWHRQNTIVIALVANAQADANFFVWCRTPRPERH